MDPQDECRPKRLSTGCRPPSSAAAGGLPALVRRYREECRWLHQQLDYYASLDLDDAIHKAALARTADGRKNRHQWRLSDEVLGAAAKALANVRTEISSCRSFERLHDLVQEVTRSISGFGRLARYDTAQRIGACLGLFPSLVFLHAGTLHGFHALGLHADGDAVSPDVFPDPIRSLRAHEIEDFLCIFAEELTLT